MQKTYTKEQKAIIDKSVSDYIDKTSPTPEWWDQSRTLKDYLLKVAHNRYFCYDDEYKAEAAFLSGEELNRKGLLSDKSFGVLMRDILDRFFVPPLVCQDIFLKCLERPSVNKAFMTEDDIDFLEHNLGQVIDVHTKYADRGPAMGGQVCIWEARSELGRLARIDKGQVVALHVTYRGPVPTGYKYGAPPIYILADPEAFKEMPT